MTSHAYEGDLFDNDGKPIHFSGAYRTDFMTGLAQRFLRSAKSPFLLTLSYLEVHHQNDSDTYEPPKEFGAATRIPLSRRTCGRSRVVAQPVVRLLRLRGKMDETVGTIRKTLVETGLDKNTILVVRQRPRLPFQDAQRRVQAQPARELHPRPADDRGAGIQPRAWRFRSW